MVQRPRARCGVVPVVGVAAARVFQDFVGRHDPEQGAFSDLAVSALGGSVGMVLADEAVVGVGDL